MTPSDAFPVALLVVAFLAAIGIVVHLLWRRKWVGDDAGLSLIVEDHYEEPESPALAEAYALLADLKAQGAPMADIDDALDTICALTPKVGVE